MQKSTFPIQQINTSDISIDENGSAYSNIYADIYYQPGIGLDEKRHVFLSGNSLPQNWQHKHKFVVAETGFGTGLNFLMTWQAWENNRGSCNSLEFISSELHPMSKLQLQKCLSIFTELEPYSKQLIAKYPDELIYGIHRIEFSSSNIVLTLIFADAAKAFGQLNTKVDAWYLDGFGPSKNPDMWSESLFQAIAKLSDIGTSAATFTVARKIREGLNHVGFEIIKSKGFGQKREMLKAQFLEETKRSQDKQPWANTFKASPNTNITIIGAGIAGLTLASNLSKKGKKVTLIDRHPKPCSEASGNPQAMIMPMLTLNDSKEAKFYLRAFLYACNYYHNEFFHQNGVLQLAFSEKEKRWQEKLLYNFDLPTSLLCKHTLGLLYPNSGWLDTQSFAQKQLPSIHEYIHTEVEKIEFCNKKWHLYTNNKMELNTDVLILANGIHCLNLIKDYQLPITPKHGQISYFETNPKLRLSQFKQVLLNQGYITPEFNGKQTLGATFDLINDSQLFEPAKIFDDHWNRNIDMWQNSDIYNELNSISATHTRAGIRVTTPDHLPICGALIDQKQFIQDYSDLHHGRHWQQYKTPKAIENLYIFTGLGSRGYTSAPLLAEFLSNQILGETQILETSMQKSINPNRFLFHQLKKIKPSLS